MNKEYLKRYSSYAAAISLVLSGVLVYIPDMVPATSVPYVMFACVGIIKVCQVIKQETA